MSKAKQFGLLLWKNWLVVKRKKILTFVEIVLPSIFALIFFLIKLRITVTEYPNGRTWEPFSNLSIEGDEFLLEKQLAHFPSNNLTDSIMANTKVRLGNTDPRKLTFNSEEEMESFFQNGNLVSTNLMGAIVFDNVVDQVPDIIRYRIRFFSEHGVYTDSNKWFTNRKFPFFSMPGPRADRDSKGGSPYYYLENFLLVQKALDDTLIELLVENDNETSAVQDVGVSMMRMPYPSYIDDPFIIAIQNQFPFLILISFTIIAPNIAKDIILEKEKRLKEFMKMMGMESWLHWTAWFIKYFVFTFVSSCLMTLFYCVPSSSGAVLNHTDPSVLLVFFLLYSIASIAFCFACSVFFKKSSQGAAATGILFFLSYVPYFFLQMRY